jgi:5-methylcytosine-specific restriction endonuclease McrA
VAAALIDWDLLKRLTDDVPYGLERETERKHIPRKVRDELLRAHGYRCQLCGRRETGPLHLHHRLPHAESTADNLVVLCRCCHQTVHCLLHVQGKWRFVNVLSWPG